MDTVFQTTFYELPVPAGRYRPPRESFSQVSEVMVNGADDVFVERKGRIERVPDGLFEGGGGRPPSS